MLSDEEKKAMKYFYNLRATIDESNMLFDEDIDVKCGKETIKQITTILNLIEKQSKEIEELKDMNERQKYRIELVSEDKIEERGDSIDESTMLKQIKRKLDEKNIPIETLLAEFERLEDIEDRKVQIEYNNVFNKGVKSVEDKIKAEIEELQEDIKYSANPLSIDNSKFGIKVLQSFLEKE